MNEKTEMLHELCKVLEKELESVNDKISRAGGMSAGDLETVDKLTHAMKSIKTTIAMIDEGYSNGYMPRVGTYSRNGMSYADEMGNSYARRRDSMGRYSRYSRNDGYSYADGMDELIEEMRGMMPDLPAEKQREVQRFIEKMR